MEHTEIRVCTQSTRFARNLGFLDILYTDIAKPEYSRHLWEDGVMPTTPTGTSESSGPFGKPFTMDALHWLILRNVFTGPRMMSDWVYQRDGAPARAVVDFTGFRTNKNAWIGTAGMRQE